MTAPLSTSSPMAGRAPTNRLLAGLLVTLLAVGVYSGYTVLQLRSLRRLQSDTIDRNRLDSLLLLRIQNSLNLLALTMRDMLDTDAADAQRYPLTAWQPQFRHIRTDLDDALKREADLAVVEPNPRIGETSPSNTAVVRDPAHNRQIGFAFERIIEICADMPQTCSAIR